MLAAVLAGCAEFQDNIGMSGTAGPAPTPDYSMAAPEPVMA